MVSLRSDCIAKNTKTSLIPSKEINFTYSENLNFESNIPIPHNVLPKINLHFVDTQSLSHATLKLHEVQKKLEDIENQHRTENWYHTSINWLNNIGYVSIVTIMTYVLYRLGILSAMFVCIKGLSTYLWNSMCCRRCHIINYNCSNVNINDGVNFTPLQVRYATAPAILQVPKFSQFVQQRIDFQEKILFKRRAVTK